MAAAATVPAGTATDPASTRPHLVFVDGTFAELIQELADYLQIGPSVQPLLAQDKAEDALAKVVEASGALHSVPEREFAGAYNLLIHLAVTKSKDPRRYLQAICQNLQQKPVTSAPVNGVGLALNALQAVFNLLEPTNPMRYNVFMSIVRFLRVHGLYDNLRGTLPHLTQWLQDWDVSEEAQRKLYLEIVSFASDVGEEKEAYQYLLKALRTFDTSDDAEIKSDEAAQLSLRAVRMALLSSTQYDFQDLRVLPPVQALSESHAEYAQLLDVFAEQDLEDYNDFREEHPGWVEAQQPPLDGDKLLRKIRLLTFTSLAASTQSRQIAYGRIAQALQVPEAEVEVWAIDVIRAGLVEGKLSQQQGVFLVHRTTYRVFGEKQWRELGTRIDQWRASLRSVLTVLRQQQHEVEAQRQREAQELERKLANASLGDGSGGGGGNHGHGHGGQGGYQRRGGQRPSFQPRQQRAPRTDNDD